MWRQQNWWAERDVCMYLYACGRISRASLVLRRANLPEIVGPGSSHAARRVSRRRRASAVTVHHTQRDAGRESHYERRREEVHDGSDLRLAIIVRQHYATVHPAIMAGKLGALVTQLAGEVRAIDYRGVSAALDVHQEHRLDVPRGGHCFGQRGFVTAKISGGEEEKEESVAGEFEFLCLPPDTHANLRIGRYRSSRNGFQFFFHFPPYTHTHTQAAHSILKLNNGWEKERRAGTRVMSVMSLNFMDYVHYAFRTLYARIYGNYSKSLRATRGIS